MTIILKVCRSLSASNDSCRWHYYPYNM